MLRQLSLILLAVAAATDVARRRGAAPADDPGHRVARAGHRRRHAGRRQRHHAQRHRRERRARRARSPASAGRRRSLPHRRSRPADFAVPARHELQSRARADRRRARRVEQHRRVRIRMAAARCGRAHRDRARSARELLGLRCDRRRDPDLHAQARRSARRASATAATRMPAAAPASATGTARTATASSSARVTSKASRRRIPSICNGPDDPFCTYDRDDDGFRNTNLAARARMRSAASCFRHRSIAARAKSSSIRAIRT